MRQILLTGMRQILLTMSLALCGFCAAKIFSGVDVAYYSLLFGINLATSAVNIIGLVRE